MIFLVGATYLPVPARLDVCGFLLALSCTISWPVCVPVTVGLKVTLIVHAALAFKLASHVVAETEKWPVVEIAIPVRSTDWLFVRVKVFAALVVPTFCGA